ncbi:MAG: pyridoxamine 5'-phosphate oxidase family protein [Acidimicrobiia bacterium]|nr:pyridoxamine 5'-phosphate oxidase family protein [Acidimicrobiia bacterium]NNL47210.1 pyridoxamine 5'-phosphate oxidase family protein [Acidimicrobiia bacterium]
MPRRDISMTESEVKQYVAASHTLQVATIGADGWPHVAPMWFVVDEDGRVAFRSFTKSQKIRNLNRNPTITVLVESGIEYGDLQGVMIKGTATLHSDRDVVLRIYGDIARKYHLLGVEDPDAELIEAALGSHASKNTAVTVNPVSIISWDHRKLLGAY